MTTGINMPFKASRSGGMELISGKAQKAKILALSLSEGGDDNPFQDLGISVKPVYSRSDITSVSEFKIEIKRILKKMEGKIKLKAGSKIELIRDENGNIGASFEWIDLDTEEEGEATIF